MEALRPNLQRAKIAIVCIYIAMSLDVISVISDYMQYNLLTDASNGVAISQEDATINDLRQRLIALINLVVIAISGIMFICWFRRAYFNLHQKTDYLTASEGWAAGAWFVPILCWFRPYQIMRDLYVETDKILARRIEEYKPRTNLLIMGSWWALWLISSLVGNSVLTRIFSKTTIDGLISSTVSHMIMSLLGIPLAFLAVKLVKDYSGMETMLSELKDEPSEPSENIDVIPVPAN